MELHDVLNINIISRLNPVPLVYLYSALVQLLSNFIVDEDNTMVLTSGNYYFSFVSILLE